MLFKTPNKMHKLKEYPHAGEANPSTACRNPKKRHLIAMRGKTGVISPLFVLLIVIIFLLPFLVGQNTNPIIFNLQTEDLGISSMIPEYGAVLDIVSTFDGGSAFLSFLRLYSPHQLISLLLATSPS
ncbi:MAG: hypothetical protein ACFFDT_01985, partial [Candidatus Hodarchaeota archaeon]